MDEGTTRLALETAEKSCEFVEGGVSVLFLVLRKSKGPQQGGLTYNAYSSYAIYTEYSSCSVVGMQYHQTP